MELLGKTSEMRLRQDVYLKRGDMQVTSEKGEVFLENKNKKLKYFVLNDDVKVTEKLVDATGKPITRKAFAERMEGFGEDRLVLSGAPRVEQGKDVVKGYRITLREKMEFLEVEDAMSDLETKKTKKGP
jgi:lipopolysaccharide export system protein LptA